MRNIYFRQTGFQKVSAVRCLLFVLMAGVFLLPGELMAGTPKEDLDAANQAYSEGRNDDAARLFSDLIKANGYSAPLCFNLGNAEAKAGHVGLALLNYERARYLAPADADIDHNLQVTRKQAGLAPNSYRWWQIVLLRCGSLIAYPILFILVLLVGSVVGTAYAAPLADVFNLSPSFVKRFFKTVLFVGIPVVLFLGFAELCALGFSQRVEGVVTSKNAILHLSPFESAEKIGTLPEGELVTVEQRHDDYFWIEARDHHFGWVQRKDLEPVIAGSFDQP